jgi:DtxR family Mn-dependent transcriptional regulator
MTQAHTMTVDRYLETIFCIAAEGEIVRPSRLAYWLAVSPPTVSQALQRMERDGWIKIATNRSISLTDAGIELGATLVRRHRVLERWLTDVLGFDWATADVEADRLSSAISETVIDRIDLSMDSPLTCPHGNPIPGRVAPYGELIALADLEPGAPARIRRISEVAEHEARSLLQMLAEHAIKEGSEVIMAASSPSTKEVSVTIAGESLSLPLEAAHLIWVEPLTGLEVSS